MAFFLRLNNWVLDYCQYLDIESCLFNAIAKFPFCSIKSHNISYPRPAFIYSTSCGWCMFMLYDLLPSQNQQWPLPTDSAMRLRWIIRRPTCDSTRAASDTGWKNRAMPSTLSVSYGLFSPKNSQNTPHKSPIRRRTKCLLWVQSLMFVLPQPLQYCMYYHVVLDRVITTSNFHVKHARSTIILFPILWVYWHFVVMGLNWYGYVYFRSCFIDVLSERSTCLLDY